MSQRMLLLVVSALLLSCSTLNAATQAQIDQAVQKGVQYLRSVQAADGSWDYPAHTEGATALAALALLESDVKPTDPAIQRAARLVRSRAGQCTQTYSIALMIFFLDRLGDRQDEQLIGALGERLRNGQSASGAWTYFCGTSANNLLANVGGDNSNTQFAILGLWVARRHNVNVKDALERTDKYFRGSQAQDGGWDYTSGGSSTGAMTCAGLLGLLVQLGNQAELRAGRAKDLKANPPGKAAAAAADPLKDPAVQAGLKRLGQFLAPQDATQRFAGAHELYYIWSVERVGMAYGLKMIGTVDWYAAGADRLLATQAANGSWTYLFSPNAGTSLALLFLKRANVASDLTRLVGGDSALRAGRDLDDLKNIGEAATAGPLRTGDIPSASPVRLKSALAGANNKLQTAILEELRDRKGPEATLALAESVALLSEPLNTQARKFLVERLDRMTPATLVRYLEYEDDELRLAAAKASLGKQDRALVGPLLNLLEERNAATADAAHAALVEITGQEFGAFRSKTTAERFVVIKRWKSWWAQQQTK